MASLRIRAAITVISIIVVIAVIAIIAAPPGRRAPEPLTPTVARPAVDAATPGLAPSTPTVVRPTTDAAPGLAPSTPTVARPTTDAAAPSPTTSSRRIAVRLLIRQADAMRYRPVIARIERDLGDVVIDLVAMDAIDLAPPVAGAEPWRRAASPLVAAADVLPDFPWTLAAGQTGMLLDLRAFLRDLPPDIAADFPPGALPDDNAPLWLLPAGMRVTLLRMDAAAPPLPPRASWTAIFAAVTEARRQQSAPVQGVYDPTGGAVAFAAAIFDLGLDWRSVDPRDVDLTAPAVRQALEQTCRRIDDGTVTISETAVIAAPYDPSAWTSARADRAAQWVPWPPPAAPPFHSQVAGWSVSSSTNDPQAAWRVALALTAAAPDLLTPDIIPARQSARARSAPWGRLPDGARAAVIEAWRMDRAMIDPAIVGALGDAIQRACLDREPIDAALNAAQRDLADLLARQAAWDANPPDLPAAPTAVPPPAIDAAQGAVVLGGNDPDAERVARDALARSGVIARPASAAPLVGAADRAAFELAQRSDCLIWDAPLPDSAAALMDAMGAPAQNAPPAVVALLRRADGVVIGAPWRASSYVLVYRPSLFRAAGEREPTPAWTWDDLEAAARRLTDERRGVYGYAPLGAPLADLRRYLEARGVPLAPPVDGEMTPRIDDPQTVAAVRRYLELIAPLAREGARFADDDGAGANRMLSLIAEGRVAMWLSPPDVVHDDPDARVAPWPSGGWLPPSAVRVSAVYAVAAAPGAARCAEAAQALQRDPPLPPGMIAIAPAPNEDDLQQAVRASLRLPVDPAKRDALPWVPLRWTGQALDDALRDPARLNDRLGWAQRRATEYALCLVAMETLPNVERWCAEAVRPDDPLPPAPAGDPPTGD